MEWLYLVFSAALFILDIPTTYQYLDGCSGYVDVVFLVDSSESMIDLSPYGYPLYAWQQHQAFLKKIVQHLPVDRSSQISQVSLVTFSRGPYHVFHLNQHSTSIRIQDAISGASFLGGNTNCAGALRTVRETTLSYQYGARSYARKVVVVFTDGLSNVDEYWTILEARQLKQSAEVFTVTLTKEHNMEVLRNISSTPLHDHILLADDINDLDDWLALTLAHRICNMTDPVVTEPPPTCMPNCQMCSNEKTCEKCKLGFFPKNGRCAACMENCAVCRSAQTCDACNIGWYWEPLANLCQECELIADLAFVIDSSGSIRDKNPSDNSYDNYQLLKNFINHIIERLDIGPDTTRVGAVRFSSDSKLIFNLDEFSNKAGMKEKIHNMKYDGHETNIANALEVMRTEVFVAGKGDRPDVRNIGIIVTDGESNVNQHNTIYQADLAKHEGAVLFVVGITDMINKQELTAIASDPDSDHFFNSTEIRYLDSIMQNLIKHVCTPLNQRP